ncbi:MULTISPECIES: alpha/beta fold hydrolase [Pseudonocardia]|uniref:Alpha/beta hydrolase family protein n=2 Tax=Pseudonocardia TaxID=1847 RepID=A0A1Y2MQ43_PSEAH|nr:MULTISPECIES: alpha/beta hydrolase [Pseudonocardia]OSY36817.1 Alpha/beta hydrolase family protein [Pseudonocardia autotrophica]TDN76808.1 thioesterase domain-containing protein [Pseudonocardia autotrophica]BBG00809.1 alpha/beta hydrolase [Pseudonocardia autotrophica]GEC29459.1 alpha/beta hydrolase [Pseudonocardia saturnea]
MTTFALVPGAGTDSWYWGPLARALTARGHRALPVELPCDDDGAHLEDYADAVVTAVRADGPDPDDLVVVGHSFGGFTAPLVCDRIEVRELVLVTAMVPAPGESGSDWWAATGHRAAFADQLARDGRDPDDVVALYYHDVPEEIANEALQHERDQSGTAFEQPWPREGWPSVRTRFLLCREDKLFPPAFVRTVLARRLRGVVPEMITGSHHPMLSHPVALAGVLTAG